MNNSQQELLTQESPSTTPQMGELFAYHADGELHLDVRLENETVWLTQAQMAELFNTDRTSVLKHIKNIYQTQELSENVTCAKIAQVRNEGGRRITRTIPQIIF